MGAVREGGGSLFFLEVLGEADDKRISVNLSVCLAHRRFPTCARVLGPDFLQNVDFGFCFARACDLLIHVGIQQEFQQI